TRSSMRRRRRRSSGKPLRATRYVDSWRSMSESSRRSERLLAREARPLRKELLVSPWPELGLVAFDGPNDPEPELVVEGGRVVRLDGRSEDEFDVIDRFLVRHGLDLDA